MRKLTLPAMFTMVIALASPASAQTATDMRNSPSGSAGASTGASGSAAGQKIEKPTSPQEQNDLRENPNQVPPSQRVDPENPTSPSVNGTADH